MGESVWDRLDSESEAVSRSKINAIWEDATNAEQASEIPRCQESIDFEAKLDETIFAHIGSQPSKGQIAQAKYFLQEQWHVWRRRLPQSHIPGNPQLVIHPCLDDTYHKAYERLDLLELKLRPAAKIITDYDEIEKKQSAQEPPTQPEQTIAGLVLGDTIEWSSDESDPESST